MHGQKKRQSLRILIILCFINNCYNDQTKTGKIIKACTILEVWKTVNYKKNLKRSQTNHYTLAKIVLTDIGSGDMECTHLGQDRV
jgi:hypothetical protein